MPDRRKRTPQPVKLRPGDIEHDGSGCPVDPLSRPAVVFRYGARVLPNVWPAENWQRFASGDCWAWQGREPGGFDIIAYAPED